MELLRNGVVLLTLAGLVGCAGQVGRLQQEANHNVQAMTYVSNGVTYDIEFKWDNLLAGYGLRLTRQVDMPFTGAPGEDTEAQNTMRDAFRANVCNPGLHPGLVQLGYGYDGKGGWTGKIKCTEKMQKNV